MSTSNGLEFHEMLNLLQSNDCSVDEIKSMVHDHLKQNKEASHLNLVVDYYMGTDHPRYLEILIGIREPHDKHLFDKLNSCLKGRVRLKALTLLSHIIYRQPTWLHEICQHSILPSILKILKSDTNVLNLMCGVLVVATILPVIPSTVGPFLEDMFNVFTRLASWHTNTPGEIPKVHLMHLHVATYAMFHRLYSMYPCHFLAYLRTYFNSRERKVNFVETIRPMLERVRMHPSLIISSKANELSLNRWKSMETHDIVVECAKLSLDPNEGMREEQVTAGILHTALQKLKYSYKSDLPPMLRNCGDRLPPIPVHERSLIGQAICDPHTTWSPSYTCGLNTPPPSLQISPSSSYKDKEYLGTGFSTARANLKKSDCREAGAEKTSPRTSYSLSRRSPSNAGEGVSALKRFPSAPEDFSRTLGVASIEHCGTSPEVGTDVAQEVAEEGTLYYPSRGKAHHGLDDHRKVVDRDDSEVASLTGLTFSDPTDASSGSRSGHLPPSGYQPVSGRGSTQWCQSPYLEMLQDSHRGRSYSQGKRAPKRRWARRSSLKSRSLPDLRGSQERSRISEYSDPYESSPIQLPFQHLFDLAMPGAFGLPADDQQKVPKAAQGASASPQPSGVPAFVELSPPQLLDQYLKVCGELHRSKAAVAASPRSTSAGARKSSLVVEPSANQVEMDVLNGQVQLLHTQLLYERQKRELHAERNRRLLGKAKRARALEEESNAMKDQVSLLEREIANLSATMGTIRKGHHDVLTKKNVQLATLQDALKGMTKENDHLKGSVEELTFKLDKTTTDYKLLKIDLDKVQADLFGTHHELQVIQEQVTINDLLRREIEKLNKELILVTELNERYRENESLLPKRHQQDDEDMFLHQTVNREMHRLRQTLESRTVLLDSSRSRISELEEMLTKKDAIITQQKRLLKNTKEEFDRQVECLERKYEARGKICQELESGILKEQHHVHCYRATNKMLRLRLEQKKERQNSGVATAPSPPPPEMSTPEMASMMDEDPVSYFYTKSSYAKAHNPVFEPEVGVRRASRPIDIDAGAGRARDSSEDEDGTDVDEDRRSHTETDFFGGRFEGISESDMEMQRNFLRRGNERSVLESGITSRSLAALIDEIEQSQT